MTKPVTIEVKPEDLTTVEELDTHKKLDTCPRCNMPGFLTQRECWNSQAPSPTHYAYYFFGHNKNGKRTWCYLGKRPEKWFWTKLDKERVQYLTHGKEEVKQKP